MHFKHETELYDVNLFPISNKIYIFNGIEKYVSNYNLMFYNETKFLVNAVFSFWEIHF